MTKSGSKNILIKGALSPRVVVFKHSKKMDQYLQERSRKQRIRR